MQSPRCSCEATTGDAREGRGSSTRVLEPSLTPGVGVCGIGAGSPRLPRAAATTPLPEPRPPALRRGTSVEPLWTVTLHPQSQVQQERGSNKSFKAPFSLSGSQVGRVRSPLRKSPSLPVPVVKPRVGRPRRGPLNTRGGARSGTPAPRSGLSPPSLLSQTRLFCRDNDSESARPTRPEGRGDRGVITTCRGERWISAETSATLDLLSRRSLLDRGPGPLWPLTRVQGVGVPRNAVYTLDKRGLTFTTSLSIPLIPIYEELD